MDVVLASGNPGKLREMNVLFEPLGWRLRPQSDWIEEGAEETGTTFVENAILKARYASAAAARPAIADDSGLVVPELGGAPGIYSARYAGPEATDADNNAALMRALADLDRPADHVFHAYFHSSLVFMRSATDPRPIIASADWHGTLTSTPRGDNGFGYDPHFIVAELSQTSAELDKAEKNRRSHRGQASRLLLDLIRAARDI